MAELVATMVVGPLLSIVKDKASSYLLDKYKVMEGMEEQHRILTRKLPAIMDVITDAEEAASCREGVKAWLLEVKRVAYEANEIFDEFKYEALRREAKKNGHYNELGFDVIKLFPTHNRFVFRKRMGKKLCRVVQAIEVLVAEMNAFRFKFQQPVPASKQWRQTDHVIFDPKKIISRSRDQDTRNIVDTLLGQASNADLTVVPIVGVGGLGKTTLAQLIYNEPKIQKHFELLLWVCVSDSFDVNSLVKSIVEAASQKSKAEAGSKKGPLDTLQDVLKGHRYLLVLDDVWNREPDKWEKLKDYLTHGANGSVVLTTTRDEGVAKIMGTVNAYNLAALDDNFIKQIIETRAFSLQKEEERPAVLVNMVGEIVKRCRGSPLAATAMGSVLRTKTSEEEWKAISVRSNICTEESGILPILKLSYNDLSSQMKQCFAFCAVFSKDYEIDVDKLIQLWIAHGFIQNQKEGSPETIGKRIFRELASRSFFVDVKQVEVPIYRNYRRQGSYRKHTCKIHDLMHDVAQSTMENECALAPEKPSLIEWLPDTARHLLLSCKQPETVLNDSLAKRSPAIQTLMCDTDMHDPLHHLSKYSSLKALQLCAWRSFPLKSKHLHHLRYLDLSRSKIESLPEDISILYNLQTLNVSGCSELRRLPRQMKYMTALRHLYTHDCPEMSSMPGDLRKLTSLQTLTSFVAGGSGSEFSSVGELEQLNLGGQLEILQLQNVTEEDAKKANMGKKKELRELKLKWSVGCENDVRVLEGLRPHDGLQAVRIESYGGTTFPTWMSMLQDMVEIHLFYCKKLQQLFSCDASFTFPNLREFTLQRLDCLERWWEKCQEEQGKEIIFPQLEKLSIVGCAKLTALPEATLLGESHGTMARSAFPVLKVLCLDSLDSFHKWEAIEGPPGGHIVFPKLEELTIEKCPVMTALPVAPFGADYSTACSVFPALKVLKLENLESFERFDAVEGTQRGHLVFPNLEELTIQSCHMLSALPVVAPIGADYSTACSVFPALKVLKLEKLGRFERFDAVQATQRGHIIFPNLEELAIEECPVMTALLEAPFGADYGTACSAFPALKVLKLESLEHFDRFNAIEGTQRGHIIFPSLKELAIDNCPVLTALPEAPFDGERSMVHPTFPALKLLTLKYLLSFEGLDGVEGSEGNALMFPQLEKVYVIGCEKMTGQQKVCPKLTAKAISPKLSVLDMEGSEEVMFLWLARHMTSVTNLKLEHLGETETTLVTAGHSLKLVVDIMEKGNHNDFPLTDMELRGFKSGVTELCACFVQLQHLFINHCAALVHWPEKEFQRLVSLRSLKIWSCGKLVGYAPQAPGAEPSITSEPSSKILPRLESLFIYGCESMVEVFKLPASLREMNIRDCIKLKSIFSWRLQQGQSASSILQGPSPVYSEVSSSSSSAVSRAEHFRFPCLEKITIRSCDRLTGALYLPSSLKEMEVYDCDGLRSLESHSGDMPFLLENLYIRGCKTLSSLPDGPHYSSLQRLTIIYCPDIKRLPTCLQQRLSSLEDKDLDSRYQDPSLFNPLSWRNAIRRC